MANKRRAGATSGAVQDATPSKSKKVKNEEVDEESPSNSSTVKAPRSKTPSGRSARKKATGERMDNDAGNGEGSAGGNGEGNAAAKLDASSENLTLKASTSNGEEFQSGGKSSYSCCAVCNKSFNSRGRHYSNSFSISRMKRKFVDLFHVGSSNKESEAFIKTSRYPFCSECSVDMMDLCRREEQLKTAIAGYNGLKAKLLKKSFCALEEQETRNVEDQYIKETLRQSLFNDAKRNCPAELDTFLYGTFDEDVKSEDNHTSISELLKEQEDLEDIYKSQPQLAVTYPATTSSPRATTGKSVFSAVTTELQKPELKAETYPATTSSPRATTGKSVFSTATTELQKPELKAENYPATTSSPRATTGKSVFSTATTELQKPELKAETYPATTSSPRATTGKSVFSTATTELQKPELKAAVVPYVAPPVVLPNVKPSSPTDSDSDSSEEEEYVKALPLILKPVIRNKSPSDSSSSGSSESESDEEDTKKGILRPKETTPVPVRKQMPPPLQNSTPISILKNRQPSEDKVLPTQLTKKPSGAATTTSKGYPKAPDSATKTKPETNNSQETDTPVPGSSTKVTNGTTPAVFAKKSRPMGNAAGFK